jgi:hypothetical protein
LGYRNGNWSSVQRGEHIFIVNTPNHLYMTRAWHQSSTLGSASSNSSTTAQPPFIGFDEIFSHGEDGDGELEGEAERLPISAVVEDNFDDISVEDLVNLKWEHGLQDDDESFGRIAKEVGTLTKLNDVTELDNVARILRKRFRRYLKARRAIVYEVSIRR